MNLNEKIKQKLDEFGIPLFDNYKIENENEYVFYSKDMIIFSNTDKNKISIAFQVITKPETAASLSLILNQIDCDSIEIMESFIFNQDKEFISGEEAYKFVEDCKMNETMDTYDQQAEYMDILMNSEGYEC